MKNIFLIIISVVASRSSLFGQLQNGEDSRIYSLLVKAEFLSTSKSAAIIKNCINDKEIEESTSLIRLADSTKDENWLQQIYYWTEDQNGNRPIKIDTLTFGMIAKYSKIKFETFSMPNDLKVESKVFFLKKFPIRRRSVDKDWQWFYEKYPDSDGIYGFSKISYYTTEDLLAIVYYWHRRHGLNGHGAIAVLNKVDNTWKIKYKIYLWMN